MSKFPLLAGVTLALLVTATATAPAHAEPSDCPVLSPPPSAEDLERYLCGDSRLGPSELPQDGPVGTLVEGYDRLGGLTPVEFLDRWWTVEGSWDYPEHDGFVVVDGQPVKELQELPSGWMLDRFGSPWGSFLAPAGASYEERALPPNSLNTWPDGPEHNYNCYEVTEPVTAWVGPIAPHFEQPGGGEQLLVPAEEVPEAEGEGNVPVNDLLEWGYLEQRPTEECVLADGYDLGA
ncbi:TNT domain-containing protein [Nocardiopsis sp. SBT366]|uniref:TNT domain-containing protein n=1 Tax=Nocardiopsis sp. SBT366 TaxID=1580529 RepID=UPI00066B5ACA|nr:TNT domain-containing protein [Nocardiopsis sp. SBT366]